MSDIHRVRMGEIGCAESGVLHAILGSCVGIALWRKQGGAVGLAHCLLPAPMGESGNRAARFVTSGVLNLLDALGWRQGEGLRAWRGVLAGGARTLEGAEANWEVGRLNIEAARNVLRELGVRYEELPLESHKGCLLEVDCASRLYRARSFELLDEEDCTDWREHGRNRIGE